MYIELPVKDTGELVKLRSDCFDCAYNMDLVHQVLSSILFNTQFHITHKKNRALVSGSGRKLHRQKGMGVARVGSAQSPTRRGGGVSFASNDRNLRKKINKFMYRNALKMVFSQLIREDRVVVISDIILEKVQTKLLSLFLLKYVSDKKIVILGMDFSNEVFLSARNLANVQLINQLGATTLLAISSCHKLVVKVGFLRYIEEMYAKGS